MIPFLAPYGGLFVPVVTDVTQAMSQALIAPDDVNIHLATCLPLAAFLLVTRYAVQLIAQTIGGLTGRIGSKDLKKFGESTWKFVYYTTGFLMCLYIVQENDYWPKSANCWRDVETRSLNLQGYYIWELSFYVSSLFAHVLFEVERKDYWPMFFHHIVTILLIGFSYLYGYHGIGMLVLMCHDASDVFLEGAKLFRYTQFELASTITFAMLIVSWVWYRLYLFPVFVIPSVVYESEVVLGYQITFYHFFVSWLMILQVLHVYWFVLILKVAQRSLFEGGIEDVREEDAAKVKTK
eukprot:m.70067 g.70067  ORF g.70067 m.70067 type:complete len:294 (-) comp14034_c0_seq1:192-1073(-)